MLRDRDIPTPKEAALLDTIGKVDRFLTSVNSPRIPGGRHTICRYASLKMLEEAERRGLYMQVVNVPAVHRLFGGEDTDIGVGEPPSAFEHYFNVSDVPRLLIDLTFCQFVQGENGEINQFDGHPSGNLADSPVAQALLGTGYVPLTDETLRDYLRITTAERSKKHIESATVEALLFRGII